MRPGPAGSTIGLRHPERQPSRRCQPQLDQFDLPHDDLRSRFLPAPQNGADVELFGTLVLAARELHVKRSRIAAERNRAGAAQEREQLSKRDRIVDANTHCRRNGSEKPPGRGRVGITSRTMRLGGGSCITKTVVDQRASLTLVSDTA